MPEGEAPDPSLPVLHHEPQLNALDARDGHETVALLPLRARSAASLPYPASTSDNGGVNEYLRDVAPEHEDVDRARRHHDSQTSRQPLLGLQGVAGNRAVTGLLTGSELSVQQQAAGSGSGSASAKTVGTSVSLAHAAKFDGKVLADEPGWKKHRGECATGVQYVFHMAGKPLGLTSTWTEGVPVKGNKIPPGTAIASFRNGKFAQDHAAIFVRETAEGLEVWDQYNHPSKPWGKRVLAFSKNDDRSNNGNLFHVIEH